jgi:hypothetical protein
MVAADSRWIVANLDCESTWTAERARQSSRVPSAGDEVLKRPALRAISALGTLLRVFARPGDKLWTPLPVDPARLPHVAGLATPTLVSGALADARPVAVLAWAETEAVAVLRENATLARPHDGVEWPDAVWHTTAASPATQSRLSDRQFYTELRDRFEESPAGAIWIRTVPELARHLEFAAASGTGLGRWVLKAPHSAAGRERLFGRGHDLAQAENLSVTKIERALQVHGRLLFEPWLERLADFGCSAWVGESATTTLGVHSQHVDGAGHPRGVSLFAGAVDGPEPPSDLTEPELAHLQQAIEAVGQELRGADYRGPFGIDSWRYRAADGSVEWVTLGELNVRMTMGLIARALVEQVRPPEPVRIDLPVRFVFGRQCLPESGSPGRLCVPLLLAGGDDATEAYLEYGV